MIEDNQPKPEQDRFRCTKERPWTKEDGRAVHPGAVCIYDGDYSETYRCPNCKLEFSVELPSH